MTFKPYSLNPSLALRFLREEKDRLGIEFSGEKTE
jgi:hypothetical protein